jgi:cytochrome P450
VPLTDLLVLETARRQWPKQFLLGLHKADPGAPIVGTQNDHLALVIRRDIFARLGREHCERRRLVARAFAPEARDRQERRIVQREALGYFVPVNSKNAEAAPRAMASN